LLFGYRLAQNALGEESKILNNCEQMPSEEGIETCIKGAAVETTFQRYQGFKGSSDSLCKKLSLERQTSCLSNVRRVQNPNIND